jgi:crotonobetainyl-CoA:carnitine CoA-transferase CaiB-like acyl-CoA transferase
MARPLEGLVALDLATFVAAPFCCTLLAEFGAEVIKVEQPGSGDDLRRLGRASADGPSYLWLVESRNKKSITCNLRTAEGQALIRRLATSADVVAENFRPGTLERWHLGWEDLRAVNRGLVMVRISAFGQTGPYRERPGFGRIAAAVSGASYISGDPAHPPVTPGTPTIPDYLAGAIAAFGALAALQHRGRTGDGQVVDVALYEPLLRMLDELLPVYGGEGYVRERIGSGTEYVVPHNHYRTRDGRWIAIACTTDRMFERLVTGAMCRPDLLGEFATMPARLHRRAEVDGLVQAWVAARDAAEALDLLDRAQVPSSPVNSVRDLFEDPHMKARENIVSAVTALGTVVHMAGIVPKLSLTPGQVDAPGPHTAGAHNEEIYGGRLGLGQADLVDLRARGVI